MNSQIIFFDGVCKLCNGFVDFLVRRDAGRTFRFAPLQGETARRLLPPELARDLPSIALWSQGQILVRSDAVLAILRQLGGAWWLVGVFAWLPRPLRDLGYRAIARYRYRLFGRRQSCRLPTPEERALFLD